MSIPTLESVVHKFIDRGGMQEEIHAAEKGFEHCRRPHVEPHDLPLPAVCYTEYAWKNTPEAAGNKLCENSYIANQHNYWQRLPLSHGSNNNTMINPYPRYSFPTSPHFSTFSKNQAEKIRQNLARNNRIYCSAGDAETANPLAPSSNLYTPQPYADFSNETSSEPNSPLSTCSFRRGEIRRSPTVYHEEPCRSKRSRSSNTANSTNFDLEREQILGNKLPLDDPYALMIIDALVATTKETFQVMHEQSNNYPTHMETLYDTIKSKIQSIADDLRQKSLTFPDTYCSFTQAVVGMLRQPSIKKTITALQNDKQKTIFYQKKLQDTKKELYNAIKLQNKIEIASRDLLKKILNKQNSKDSSYLDSGNNPSLNSSANHSFTTTTHELPLAADPHFSHPLRHSNDGYELHGWENTKPFNALPFGESKHTQNISFGHIVPWRRNLGYGENKNDETHQKQFNEERKGSYFTSAFPVPKTAISSDRKLLSARYPASGSVGDLGSYEASCPQLMQAPRDSPTLYPNPLQQTQQDAITSSTSQRLLPPSPDGTVAYNNRRKRPYSVKHPVDAYKRTETTTPPTFPVPPQESLTWTHAGLVLNELPLWKEHRIRVETCTRDITSVFSSPRLYQNLNNASTAIRCYCSYMHPLYEREWAHVFAYLRDNFPLFLSNGISCTVCRSREHAACSLCWLRLPVDEDELDNFIKDYVCVACRIVLADPFATVERVLSIYGFRPPIRRQESLEAKRNVFMDCALRPSELKKVREGKALVQIRGFELTPLTYRYAGFPPHVIFRASAKNVPQEPFEILKPPGPHRKRKEEPRVVPSTYLSNSGLTRIIMECSYPPETNGSPLSFYWFTAVLVKPWPPQNILETVKSKNRLSLSLSQQLCRAITEQSANTAEDDDEVVLERDDVHSLSLRCPSTLMRIGIPSRGFRCMHVQCFDLEFYIFSQTRTSSHKNRWKCPICYRFCFPYELIVDSFFQELLYKTVEGDRKVYLVIKDNEVNWRVTEHDETDTSMLDTNETDENNKGSIVVSMDTPIVDLE